MVSRKVGLKRLEKLATFLETKMPDGAFNFDRVMLVGQKQPLDALKAGGGCGTVGCAIGWTPACFPGLVEWGLDIYGEVNGGVRTTQKAGKVATSYAAVGTVLFGISDEESYCLFTPSTMKMRRPSWATPKEVAEMLRTFVAMDREERGSWQEAVNREGF